MTTALRRHGFHVVAADRRIPGETLSCEAVQDGVAEQLRANVEERALRQYVSVLAGNADSRGVDPNAASTPLVQ